MNKVKDQDVYFKSKKSRKKATQSQKNTSKSNGNKRKKSVEDENIQEGSNNFDITRSSVSSGVHFVTFLVNVFNGFYIC